MAKPFSSLKNKMSSSAQKAVTQRTSKLLKDVLLHEIRDKLHKSDILKLWEGS